MTSTVTPVPFDPELVPLLDRVRAEIADQPRTMDEIPLARAKSAAKRVPDAEIIGDRPVELLEKLVPGPPGAPDVALTIIRLREPQPNAPGLYNIHGGGLIMGSRSLNTARIVSLVLEFGFVGVNVEYRLAPEHPGTAPVEDCYAGLVWLAGHAGELGVDPNRIVVMGASAGGNLTAAVSLLARDRGGPALAGQVALCPMIDDRNETVSSHQYTGIGTWDRPLNLLAWQAVLGDRAGGPDVSPYIAPARATDLSGLPPAYIEVGSAELFRDEAVDYARRIWAAGGEAELHVWNGGFHSFEIYCADTNLARHALDTRHAWLRRLLGRQADHD